MSGNIKPLVLKFYGNIATLSRYLKCIHKYDIILYFENTLFILQVFSENIMLLFWKYYDFIFYL